MDCVMDWKFSVSFLLLGSLAMLGVSWLEWFVTRHVLCRVFGHKPLPEEIQSWLAATGAEVSEVPCPRCGKRVGVKP